VGYALAFAAGAMIYVVVEERIALVMALDVVPG
jgi:zinc transporter ZupT